MFRPAANPILFSALIGTGAQLCLVVLLVVVFAILGKAHVSFSSITQCCGTVAVFTVPVQTFDKLRFRLRIWTIKNSFKKILDFCYPKCI